MKHSMNKHSVTRKSAVRLAALTASCLLFVPSVWVTEAAAAGINPADYVDIPAEGGYHVFLNGTDYYYIDGQPVSEEYYNSYYIPSEGASAVLIDGVQHFYIDGEEVSKEAYLAYNVPSDGAYVITFDGVDYFFINGEAVSATEYESYVSNPTEWAEIPDQGLYQYTYDGTEYYVYNGQYVSEDEFQEAYYRECAAVSGFTFCESEEDARNMVTSYINSINWDDSGNGITVVFHADSEDPLADLRQTGHGCCDQMKDACLEPASSSVWMGDGYIALAFCMMPVEVHYTGFTSQQYEAADKKASEIAAQFQTGTDLEKVQNVYQYLCDTIEYDQTLEHGTVYDALIEGNTVCMGYASAFQMIMEKLGIESYLCSGDDVDDGTGHAWNAVEIDGQMYYVDATFGDTSGLTDMYFLFGTDLRNDMYNLGISDHSYYQSASLQYAAYDNNGQIILVDEKVDNLVEETSDTPEVAPPEVFVPQVAS